MLSILSLVACNWEDDSDKLGIMFNPGCDLEPTVSYLGGSLEFTFITSYNWTAYATDDWVTVSPMSGSKTDESFSVDIQANPEGEDRTSSVVVELSNGKSVTIPILQQMMPRFSSNASEIMTIGDQGGVISIAVETNQEYSIVVSREAIWLRSNVTRAMRNETIELTISENLTNSSRVAQVRAITEDNDILGSFTVIQSTKGNAVNEIVYHTSTNEPVEIAGEEGFGAVMLAHIFDHEHNSGRIIFDYVVRAVPVGTFKGCSEITSFELPDNIVKLGREAFSGCTGCKEFILPKSIEIIEGSVYDGCDGVLITNGYIPNQSTSATDPDHWLYGSNFPVVYINDGVGSGAFYDYDILQNVVLGDAVHNIHNKAFEDCDNLTEVNIGSFAQWCDITFGGRTANPLHSGSCMLVVDGEVIDEVVTTDDIRKVGQFAFYNYTPIKRIVINDKTTAIGAYAFSQCDVESIELSSSILSIGNSAFSQCRVNTLTINGDFKEQTTTGSTSRHWFYDIMVENIVFSDKCSTVNDMIFSDINFHTLTIASTVKSICNGAFAGCHELHDVDLGIGLEYIGNHTFYECTSLAEVILPESLTTINGYAFKGCSAMERITLPAAVSFIGEYAFYNCTNLNEIYCEATTPPTLGDDYVFDGHPDQQRIYVPLEAVDAYKSAPGWRRYAQQIRVK